MGNLVASDRDTLIYHSFLRPVWKKFFPQYCLFEFPVEFGPFCCFAFIWNAFSALFSVSPRHILISLPKKNPCFRPDGLCVSFSSLRKSLYFPLIEYSLKAGLQSSLLECHYPTLKFPLDSTFCQLVALNRIMFTLSM